MKKTQKPEKSKIANDVKPWFEDNNRSRSKDQWSAKQSGSKSRVRADSKLGEVNKANKKLTWREFVGTSWWVLKFNFRMFPSLTLIILFSKIWDKVSPLLYTFFLAKFVDYLTVGYSSGNVKAVRVDNILPWLIGFVLYHLISLLIDTLNTYAKNLEEVEGLKQLEIGLTEKLCSLDIQELENSELTSKVFRASNRLDSFFNLKNRIMFAIAVGVSVLITIVGVSRISIWSVVILIIILIPRTIIYNKLLSKAWKFVQDNTERSRIASSNMGTLLSVKSLNEIIISNGVQFFLKKYVKFRKFYDNTLMRLRITRWIVGYGFSVIFLVVVFMVGLQLIRNFVIGVLSVGNLILYLKLLMTLVGSLQTLSGMLTAVWENTIKIQDLVDVFRMESKFTDGKIRLFTPQRRFQSHSHSQSEVCLDDDEQGIENKLGDLANKPPLIEVEHLSFKYPNSTSMVLNDINLKIKPGEKVAIVGHNGAGKTTLIKLLMRLYRPVAGEIRINKIPLNEIRILDWYRIVAMLSQDYNTYPQLSVADNIAVGDIEKWFLEENFNGRSGVDNAKANVVGEGSQYERGMISTSKVGKVSEAILKAAKMADAYDFIKKYEDGFSQLLSESLTGGIRPSTGQWQKIALARFFYRNSKVLIFDEPTASIDAIAEFRIFNNIMNHFQNRSVIIISHRFSTVRKADRIIVLRDGAIIEQGMHQELLNMKGVYAHLFEVQAKGYR